MRRLDGPPLALDLAEALAPVDRAVLRDPERPAVEAGVAGPQARGVAAVGPGEGVARVRVVEVAARGEDGAGLVVARVVVHEGLVVVVRGPRLLRGHGRGRLGAAAPLAVLVVERRRVEGRGAAGRDVRRDAARRLLLRRRRGVAVVVVVALDDDAPLPRLGLGRLLLAVVVAVVVRAVRVALAAAAVVVRAVVAVVAVVHGVVVVVVVGRGALRALRGRAPGGGRRALAAVVGLRRSDGRRRLLVGEPLVLLDGEVDGLDVAVVVAHLVRRAPGGQRRHAPGVPGAVGGPPDLEPLPDDFGPGPHLGGLGRRRRLLEEGRERRLLLAIAAARRGLARRHRLRRFECSPAERSAGSTSMSAAQRNNQHIASQQPRWSAE